MAHQSMPELRPPAVAGQFYSADAGELKRTVAGLIGAGRGQKALGAMVPHAGYIYSGSVAGEVYGRLELPETFVIVGPNHTGLGAPAAIMTSGIWKMPAGNVDVDTDLASAITVSGSVLQENGAAHAYEHSIEVQLPFLQYLVKKPLIVPVCLMPLAYPQCREIGHAIAAAVRSSGKQVLIIASSDMSHYENQEDAKARDKLALAEIMRLDGEGLLQTVQANHITMCGAAPVAAMLSACVELGATGARLVRYATSGDVTGDFSRVVGYAGVVII